MSVLECHGKPNTTLLRAALSDLVARYPILRSRIVNEGYGRMRYVEGDALPELFECNKVPVSLWLRDSFNSWDPSKELMRLALIRNEQQEWVALQVDHAIADGRTRDAAS